MATSTCCKVSLKALSYLCGQHPFPLGGSPRARTASAPRPFRSNAARRQGREEQRRRRGARRDLIAFAASSVPLRNMIHTGSFINDGIPIFDVRKFGGTADDMLIRNPALGQSLATVLGNKTAVLMFGHGVAVTGPSLATAVSNAYFLNMNARIEEQAIGLGGTVSYLEREPSARRSVNVTPAGAAANNRAWEYWKYRVTSGK